MTQGEGRPAVVVPEARMSAMAQEAARGDGWVKIVADWIDRDLGPEGDLRPLWPDDVLTAGNLSDTFGLPLELTRTDGRFTARSAR